MAVIVAVDIGGTQIRVAVFPKDGIKPIKVSKIPTIADNVDSFSRMADQIQSIWPQDLVDAISIAAAGPVDPTTGIVIAAANIPGWKNFPLRERLVQIFDVPVYVGNDANLAALGEWHFGAGRGHHHILYITVSTGIGGGVICADHLLEGSRGLGAELGHVTILPEGPMCACGVRGHLEALSSGTAIANYVSEQILQGRSSIMLGKKKITARTACEAAGKGDELAIESFQRAGYYLGLALAGFLQIFNPSILILGGGVSQSGALLFEPMKSSIRMNLMTPAYLDGLEIVTAQLGDDVGLLGALALARMKLQGK